MSLQHTFHYQELASIRVMNAITGQVLHVDFFNETLNPVCWDLKAKLNQKLTHKLKPKNEVGFGVEP